MGPRQQAPSSPSAEVREILSRASPEDLKEANRRYRIIAPVLVGQPLVDTTTPARTVRTWVAKFRKYQQVHRCGYAGLIRQTQQRGNRNSKLPESTLTLLDAFIKNDYETLKQKHKYEVYAVLIKTCEERGIIAPSYLTFASAVKKRPRREQTQNRQGERAASQLDPFYWELAMTTPRHGDRPFEINHIDHTELDIELICSRTGRNLGRPYVTFLTDAFSRRILALYLTFDPPCYRSCMMVLRECVRRHGRLPQIIVVDGGPEFQSTYFETLLARYECTKKLRPPAKPRFGSVCERLFGTTNTQFVYNLMGNTQIMRNVRQVTKSVNPKEHAVWTFDVFYQYLCEFAYEVYDTIDHPALWQSPRDAFASGLAQSGRRPQRLIAYDDDFVMSTLPTTRKGEARVQPSHGVKINYIYYWSNAFRDPEVEKASVPVRYDPFNVGVAYAFVKGQWVKCISEHYAVFASRSERELVLTSAELRKRNQNHTRQFNITARKLADFLTSIEAQESLLAQRLRDAAASDVLALDTGGRTDTSVDAVVTRHATIGNENAVCESDHGLADDPTVYDENIVMYGDF